MENYSYTDIVIRTHYLATLARNKAFVIRNPRIHGISQPESEDWTNPIGTGGGT